MGNFLLQKYTSKEDVIEVDYSLTQFLIAKNVYNYMTGEKLKVVYYSQINGEIVVEKFCKEHVNGKFILEFTHRFYKEDGFYDKITFKELTELEYFQREQKKRRRIIDYFFYEIQKTNLEDANVLINYFSIEIKDFVDFKTIKFYNKVVYTSKSEIKIILDKVQLNGKTISENLCTLLETNN